MKATRNQTETIDQRPCEHCGTVFTPARPWGRFHTDDCRNKWHQENPNIPNPLESDGEFQMTVMNPNPSFRARRDGDHYFIELECSKEEWEWFTDPNIDRTGMVLELNGMVTHRAQKNTSGSANGRPSDFESENAGSIPAPETKPKGGQLSQEAGKMCCNPRFQDFICDKYPGTWSDMYAATADERAAVCIREICGVLSRSEIDSQPTAKKRFMDIMHEFSEWNRGRG